MIRPASVQIEANKLQGAVGRQIEPQIGVLLDYTNTLPRGTPLLAVAKMENSLMEMTECVIID